MPPLLPRSCFFAHAPTAAAAAAAAGPFVRVQLRVGAWGSNGFATTNGEFANVTIYAYHKRYNFGDNKPAFDLALLQLDRNITSALPVRLPPCEHAAGGGGDRGAVACAALCRVPCPPVGHPTQLPACPDACPFVWPA